MTHSLTHHFPCTINHVIAMANGLQCMPLYPVIIAVYIEHFQYYDPNPIPLSVCWLNTPSIHSCANSCLDSVSHVSIYLARKGLRSSAEICLAKKFPLYLCISLMVAAVGKRLRKILSKSSVWTDIYRFLLGFGTSPTNDISIEFDRNMGSGVGGWIVCKIQLYRHIEIWSGITNIYVNVPCILLQYFCYDFSDLNKWHLF